MISLLHPSRGRPQKAFITYQNWMRKAANPENIEHILSLDFDDEQVKTYGALFKQGKVYISDNDCAVKATNRAAEKATGDILIMLSDDFDCPQNWDKIIEDAFKNIASFITKNIPVIDSPNGGYVLKVFDGIQKWIVTLAIMDRAYYKMQGTFYHPGYKHLFVDTDMTHKAELEGRLIVRNDILFQHNHYSCTGGKQDETTKRADATWRSGEALYLQRVRDKFGLGDVDVLNLGKEAHESGMVKWLTDKLNGGDAKMRLPKRKKLFT